MPESPPAPPTFFANIATIHVNVDEVSIEFRRVMPPHGEIWKTSQSGKEVPAWTDDTLYEIPPIAKVVLSFLGAKVLRDNLVRLMPSFEDMRKQGV